MNKMCIFKISEIPQLMERQTMPRTLCQFPAKVSFFWSIDATVHCFIFYKGHEGDKGSDDEIKKAVAEVLAQVRNNYYTKFKISINFG